MMYSSFPYNKPVPSYWVSKIPYIFHRVTRAAKWPERPTPDIQSNEEDLVCIDLLKRYNILFYFFQVV